MCMCGCGCLPLASPRGQGQLGAAAPHPTLPQLAPDIQANATGLSRGGDRLAKSSGIDVQRCVTAHCSLQQ